MASESKDPQVGDELTLDQLAAYISGNRPRYQYDANLAFLKITHRLLKDDGQWGWPRTCTVWQKTPNGFRRML